MTLWYVVSITERLGNCGKEGFCAVEVSQEGNMLKLIFFRPPVGSAEILGGAIHYADNSTLVTFTILHQPMPRRSWSWSTGSVDPFSGDD